VFDSSRGKHIDEGCCDTCCHSTPSRSLLDAVGSPMGCQPMIVHRMIAPPWFRQAVPQGVRLLLRAGGGGRDQGMAGRVISDCHFSVQLNHFIPGFYHIQYLFFLSDNRILP
jgi:hypothetical protein